MDVAAYRKLIDLGKSDSKSDRHRLDLASHVHPKIAWPKLRALHDGAAIASKKLWS